MNITLIINKTRHLKRLAAVFLLCIFALPLSAQEKADSVFTFRFLTGKDMFFVQIMNNGEELTKLFGLVEQYKEKISCHEISIRVDGYYIPTGDKADWRNCVIRSNRVKSELITKQGLTEDNFITRNQAGQGDFVTVRLFDTNKNAIFTEKTGEVLPIREICPEEDNNAPATSISDLETVETSSAGEDTEQQPAAADTLEVMPKVKTDSRFALKTNLLGYAVLMPNAEIEWMFADRWSAALEVQGVWYAKESSPRKVYRLSYVAPELRYWAINRSRWHGMYVGVFGGVGMYDLHNSSKSDKGHIGEGIMAGLSLGYMWPIGKHLSLDAGTGVGYLQIRDKVYTPLDGHFLYQLTKDINYIGPLRLKLSLVWRFQSEKRSEK